MSEDFLAVMAQASRERVAQARALRPQSELQAQARDWAPGPALALSQRGFDLIAEVKLRSPAAGRFEDGWMRLGNSRCATQ